MTSTHHERLETASGLSRRLLALLVGLLAALALIVSGAAPASAQNAVGPQPVNSILVVGPHQAAGQENVGVRGPPGQRLVSATGVAAETATGTVSTGDVSVYTSTNAAGDVDYVGITNNVGRRAAEHLGSKGITIRGVPGLSNLSRADARSVEQVLIEQNGGAGGGQLLNKINSISPNNPIYGSSIQRGCSILGTVGYAAPGVC